MTRLTREQAAIIGVYTGIACGPFADVQAKAQELLKRPIWIHEFAGRELMAELRELAKPEFVSICAEEKK